MCLSPISPVIVEQVFRAPIDVGEQPQKIKTPEAEMRLSCSSPPPPSQLLKKKKKKKHANDPEQRNVSGMMRNVSNNLPYLAVNAAGTCCTLGAEVFEARGGR